MLTTTLNEIRKHSPCGIDRKLSPPEGWWKLMDHLGKTKADDEPISFYTILESNGIEDAFWCLRALPDEMDNQVRLLNCLIAETALKYIPEWEDRPRQAIEASRRFAAGQSSEEELADARAAARAAAWSVVGVAWTAAWAAAWAARDGARAAAGDALGTAGEQQKTILLDWLKQFDEE